MELLPLNSTPLEIAFSKASRRVSNVPVLVREQWNPQTCPAGTLAWLAFALSVDEWSADWTEQQQRDAIQQSVEVHRRKGTVGAIRRAIAAIGYDVEVDEATGVPYTFRLRVDASTNGIENEALYDEAERIALRTKNVRSHLLGVDALLAGHGYANIIGATISGVDTEILPDITTLLESPGPFRVLTGLQTADFCTVNPLTYSMIWNVQFYYPPGGSEFENTYAGLNAPLNRVPVWNIITGTDIALSGQTLFTLLEDQGLQPIKLSIPTPYLAGASSPITMKLFRSHIYKTGGGYMEWNFTDLPAGSYDILTYTKSIFTGAQVYVDRLSTSGNINYLPNFVSADSPNDIAEYTEGFHYTVKREIPVALGDSIRVRIYPNGGFLTNQAQVNAFQLARH